MVRKHNRFFLILAAALMLLSAVGFTGQNTFAKSAPAATAVSASPTVKPTAKPVSASPTAKPAANLAAASPTAKPAAAAPKPNFKLTILHTSDVHAHHGTNADGDGGEALASSVIEQVRASKPNTLLLSSGDTFMGTLYYAMHRGTDSAELMNLMKYDAMTLGNHEFDDGDGNLALFIEKLTFPVVVTNVDFSKSKTLTKTIPFVIINKGGEKIGVIGLANPITPSITRSGSELVFKSDQVSVTQSKVDELTKQGVNKIIVLSHLGYDGDLELAKAVKGVDVILGGHTSTLLANFDNRAAGPYPTKVKNPDGKTVLIAHSGEYLQYIGKLDVEFDPNGDVVSGTGDSIYLSHYISPDPKVSALVGKLFAPIEAFTKKVIGKTAVYLEGDRKVCRLAECNLGNLLTDAMRAETGAQIAIENGGGIRASIKEGDITLADVLSVLPFGNLVSTFSLSGENLVVALENGVSLMAEGGGGFLQVSGMRYTIDPKKPVGSRILSVEVLDAKGKYQPLDPKAIYSIVTNDFTREGGDGYKVLAEKAINPNDYGIPLDQVLADYIAAHSPVDSKVEGRITVK